MRAIDADRLLTDRMKEHYYHLPNGDIAIPIIDIEHAPTIVPAQPERKTGHWIKWGNRVKCDRCALTNEYVKPFCPNCGALMIRGEQNEAD